MLPTSLIFKSMLFRFSNLLAMITNALRFQVVTYVKIIFHY